MTQRKRLIILMALLAATDIAVLLDIPILRPVLGFICFTTVPGLLIIYSLKLGGISLLKRFLLSVGLSLSFLTITGLAINIVLPWLGYAKPLAALPLLTGFNLVLIGLAFIAYWRNRGDFQPNASNGLGEFIADIRGKHLWPLLFPLLFPLLVVIGRNVMDTGGGNTILVVTFVLMPLYAVLLVWQRKNVPQAAYPVAIGMISLAILLARGLISNYLVGDDVYAEYHAFQVTLQNWFWSARAFPTNVGSCLTVTLLPTVFQAIMKIAPAYIFKLVFLIHISLIPVIGYAIYKKYLDPCRSFLAALFFIAQLPFVYLLSSHIRLGMAMIPFSLLILTLFDDDLTSLGKKSLFIIFLFATVSGYYVLALILLFLLSILWITSRASRSHTGVLPVISLMSAVALPVIFIYLWWGLATTYAFKNVVFVFRDTIINLSNIFLSDLHGPDVLQLYQLPSYSFIMQIPGLIQRFSFFIVGIGTIYILVNKSQRTVYRNYMFLMTGALAILAAMVILPAISKAYGAERLYLQSLIILAPTFIAGCQAIYHILSALPGYLARLFKFIKYGPRARPVWQNPGAVIIFTGILLLAQYVSASSLYQEFFNLTGREILDAESNVYLVRYVYEPDVTAAEWLGRNNEENLPVFLGNIRYPLAGETFEFSSHAASRNFNIRYFEETPPEEESYIFLQYLNVVNRRINSPHLESVPTGKGTWICPPMDGYAYYYSDRSRIYDNGSAEIYR